jgi:hypothetical protein
MAKNSLSVTKQSKRGVFWIVDGQLLAFPFKEGATEGVAKSGDTYNHLLLWPSVRPKGCGKPFDYYPRGRVELTGKGNAVIYMNPTIGDEWLPQLCEAFSIQCQPIVRRDYSRHYRCYEEKDGSF